MASEIRVNKIINRSGLSTVTFSDTGAIVSGIITANSFSGNVTGNVTGSGANLTSIPAGQLTGTLPAISGANLTSLPSQVTINNASGNRVITSDGGTTLNGEANLTYDGTNFLIGTNTEAPYNNRNLTVAAGGSGSTTVAIEVRSPTTGSGRLIFSDGTTADDAANQGQVIYDHPNAKLQLGVAANYQNVTVESTGGTGADLHIIDGNLKVASGHGIDFSAAGNAGGMSSELLDDYEEGFFSPAWGVTGGGDNITYIERHGHYVKIGKLVYCQIYLRVNTVHANGSGSLFVSNIPFTAANHTQSSPGGEAYGSGSIAYTNGWGGDRCDRLLMGANDTKLYVYNGTSGGTNVAASISSNIGNGTQFRCNLTYMTA